MASKMVVIQAVLISLALSLSAAALVALLPLLSPSLRRSDRAVASLYLSGCVIGFWVGFAWTHQELWPDFPPADSTLWLVFWLWPTWLLALWQVWKAPSWLSMAVLRALLTGSLSHLVLAPLRANGWTLTQSLTVSLLVSLSFVLYTGLLDQVAKAIPGWYFPALLGLLTTASAALFMLGASALLNQQTLILGMTLLPPLGLLCWRRNLKANQGLIGLIGFVLLSHWLFAWLFASLQKWSLIALLAPFSSLLLKLPILARRPAWQQALLVWGLAALWLGGIVTAVVLNQPPEAYPY